MTSKETAVRAAAALESLLRPDTDLTEVAAAIEKALNEAGDGATARAARLLSASPAVPYSFKARDDFAPRAWSSMRRPMAS